MKPLDQAGTRPLPHQSFYSGCYAPHTSLYFDQHGDVRACCQNITGSLGNIRTHSIREIWDGSRTAALRSALERDDFSLGCTHCAWQDEQGGTEVRFSRNYDHHVPDGPTPTWPRQMEFALSNGCNLQCEMCTGWNSSAIRAHREKLPPIPIPYGDSFFEELAGFLPHLDSAVILGGEPFIARESLRLLGMLAALEHQPDVLVITNGTQWNKRVESLFQRLPMSIDVSLDAATKETFERIRVGASFDAVLTNLGRYASYARANGRQVGLSFCLMTTNWHEFADVLELAEQLDLDFVSVNIVTAPQRYSLYSLDQPEFRRVVDVLDAHDKRIGASLGRHRGVWDGHLDTLRTRAASASSAGNTVPGSLPWQGGNHPEVATSRALLGADGPILVVRADPSQVITQVAGHAQALLATTGTEFIGRPLPALIEQMNSAHGAEFAPSPATSTLGNEFAFSGFRDGKVVSRVRCFLFHDDGDLVALIGQDASVPLDA